MHKLIIEDDEGKAVVVPLIRDEITIGRQEGNTIRLTERNVSRRHARLVRREGRYLLEDLGSHTGTRINGAPIKASVALNDGDHITIGDYKLAIKIERPTTTTLGYPVSPAVPALPGVTPTVAASPLSPAMTAAIAAPPPAIPLEGSPTIPVRTLAEQGTVPASRLEAPSPRITAPAARLVVVTAPMAGQEFLLDRASAVIGRTQENDIVLNHKSISRHHAKIIRDGDRYVVVDLESANGVRVNGAEYERVELQSGDVLELGHVRLRFATADDASNLEGEFRFGASRKTLLLGAGGAVVLLGGAFLLFGGKKEAKLAPPTKVVAAVPPRAPDPAPPATPPPSTQAVPIEQTAPALLADAKKAYDEQKWDEALALVNKAVNVSPRPVPRADELRKAIEGERQNQARYDGIRHALDLRDYEAALNGYPAISEGSAFKEKARLLHEEARGKLIARHLGDAERRRTQGNCTEARKEADAVLSLDPENQAAQDLINRCAKAAAPKPVATALPTTARTAPTEPTEPGDEVAATAPIAKPAKPAKPERPAPNPLAPKPVVVTPPPVTAAPKPVVVATTGTRAGGRPAPARPSPESAPAPQGPDAETLLQEAKEAWSKGLYSAAIDASRKALKAKPGMVGAYQIIAVCSCSLRDADSASKAYERLDDRNKQMVKQLCARSGVTIE